MNPRQHYRQLLLLDNKEPCVAPASVDLFIDAANRSQYRRYLGEQYRSIYFAAQDTLHADALLAVVGTLCGGGLLILHAPAKGSPCWLRLCRFLASAELASTPVSAALVAAELNKIPKLTPQYTHAASPTPTPEQQAALQQLNHAQASSMAVMLNAPRGRGKSTLLGLWIQRTPERHFILSAPSKRQAEQALRSAQQPVHFVPPDQLLSVPVEGNTWLVIDEAASIPNHVLQQVMARWPLLALATTTEGYESAGRGFLLRVQRHLPHYYPQVLELTLQHPIRWRLGDPLEQALNGCFCLQQQHSSTQTTTAPVASVPMHATATYKYQYCHASSLSDSELSKVFELLMAAHYQTSPNDLRLLLDDSHHFLWLQYQQQQLVGVCWGAYEGPLPAELAQAVYQGRRRPPGNLLPQTLIYHRRHLDAGNWPMLRIIRIAVVPALQGQRAGTALLQQVLHCRQKENVSVIGTSFGGSAPLHHFWQRAGFTPVRVANQIDAASGLRSVVYVHALTPIAASACDHYTQLFAACFSADAQLSQELPWLQQWQVDYQLRLSYAEQCSQWQQLGNACRSALVDFQAGYVPFTILQPLLRALLTGTHIARQRGFAPHHWSAGLAGTLLATAACAETNMVNLAKLLGFSGKSALQHALRKAAIDFIAQLNV